MTSRALSFARAAEQLVGTSFRLHGRDPKTGLDCIGLAACALGKAGLPAHPPASYALRNLDVGKYLATAHSSGLQPVTGSAQRGDILLVRPGPAQHHLLVALGNDRFVHAHAGLRRVVVQHGFDGWTLLHHWRLTEN